MKHINIILCALGLCLIGFSFYMNHRINQETSSGYAASNAISNNPFTEMGGSMAKEGTGETSSLLNNAIASKATPYQRIASALFILGVISLLVGIVLIVLPHIRKHFKF